MDAEERGNPTFDCGVEEVGAGAEKNVGNRSFVDNELFGFLEEGVAFGFVAFVCGGGDELVIGGVFPAGVVIAALRGHQVGEGGGVVVVADPAGGGNLKGEEVLVVDVDAVFELGQGDVDAEFAPPHFLDGFDGLGVDHGCAGLEFDLGEPFATRKTGVGKELAGGGKISGGVCGGSVASGVGRYEGVGGQAGVLEDGAHEGGAVDGEAERSADAGVVEGGAGGVEAKIVGLKQCLDAEG